MGGTRIRMAICIYQIELDILEWITKQSRFIGERKSSVGTFWAYRANWCKMWIIGEKQETFDTNQVKLKGHQQRGNIGNMVPEKYFNKMFY